ncbi:GlxA family transcriptional regulator [Paracidovorax citrulli]|uniref:GlxA family transcriptional regulator n=1 Tax=Paracidovorax citrulli TaxID=80869 RepID=UPI001C5B9A62
MKTLLKNQTLKLRSVLGAPKTEAIAPIRVAFLVFPNFQPIDLSGPWQAFATANEELAQMRYELSTFGPEATASTSDGGLRILTGHSLAESVKWQPHTLVIPGGEGVHAAAGNPALLTCLRELDLTTGRTCSVCTGAFLLAATGMLDRHRVTTHWRTAERLRREFPQLDVADEQIFCESGKYWTTAGVTAGIDLALALVERDCGTLIAQRVARRLVVYLRRTGDQRQYSQTLRLQDRAGAPFGKLVEKIEARLSLPWTVDDMAMECNMSRRTFQRKFKESFGVGPSDVVKILRAEREQQLLNAGHLPRKEVARQIGSPTIRR